MILKKKKTCLGCNTEQYIFGHGLCNNCYSNPQKRKERGLKPLKRLSPIGKHKTPADGVNSLKTPYYGFKSQLELFEYLWEKHPRDKEGRMFCEFTGMRIDHLNGTDRFLNCFSHILPKGKYIHFKLFPDNIRIVHPDFHAATGSFTEDERKKHPDWDFDKWWDLVEEMKILYKTFVY